MGKDVRAFGGSTEALQTDDGLGSGCLLRVVEGPDLGTELEVRTGRIVVGTRDDADLVLTDSAISGCHLAIEVAEMGLLVEDLESTNGTWYLQSRVDRATLAHGAVIKAGRSRILLASRQPEDGPDYSQRAAYGSIVGATPVMRRLFSSLERLEGFEYTTLVLGSTGVGKDLIAREVHLHSPRASGPLEVCDCTSLPPNLAESELFGHVRGAFTGASSDHRGVFERGHQGTVFLDEIGELPLDLQPKLLRVLETQEIRRVGAEQTRQVDVRIVAATNRDLAEAVRQGRFRQDLFYRLNLVTLKVPLLRDRREDIPRLIACFLTDLGHEGLELSRDTMELFTTGYDWPGNVRELKNAITRVLAMGEPPPEMTAARSEETDVGLAIDTSASFQDEKRRIVSSFERDYLKAALDVADSNISQAARDAGVERTHFKRLLRKHGLLTSGDD